MTNSQIVTSQKIGEYTVPESWENDTSGNPISIYNVLNNTFGIDKSTLAGNEAYIFVFENNKAGNYYVNMIYLLNTNVQSYVLRNNKSAFRQFAQSTSTWASEGTKINVYKLQYNIP